MKIRENTPPRKFVVGKHGEIVISDCGKIELMPDELVSFITESGSEYDVARKSWGFYATPSVNGRLKNSGFKTALVKNPDGRYFVLIVENGKLEEFNGYLEGEKSYVVEWLDERL